MVVVSYLFFLFLRKIFRGDVTRMNHTALCFGLPISRQPHCIKNANGGILKNSKLGIGRN